MQQKEQQGMVEMLIGKIKRHRIHAMQFDGAVFRQLVSQVVQLDGQDIFKRCACSKISDFFWF